MLQGTTLDRSGAFRSGTLPPCTVWPRTVMRGKSRKLTSGPDSVPKSARRPEPSLRTPRFAARPKGVAAQRRVWGSQEGTREPYGALAPFCLRRQTAAFPPVNTGTPGRRRRPMSTLTLSVNLASSGAPLYRRNRLPSAEGKRGTFAALRRNILHCAAGFDMMKIPERGRII